MGFFEDSVDVARDVIDIAAKKTSETVEIQKLRIAIAKKKAEINRCYRQLGEYYYALYKGADNRKDECENICGLIAVAQGELSVLRDKLNVAKSLTVCAKCGGKNPKSAIFCNNCGEKL